MSAASPGTVRVELIPRRNPRHALAIPVDLTVLRSGVPETIPGRSLNFGEGGLAAVVAGELRPGDSVGIEMQLPYANHPLMAKAVVRHQAQLRCGLEFVGLSADQKTLIRHWTLGEQELKKEHTFQVPVMSANTPRRLVRRPPQRIPARTLWGALAVLTVIGILGWWQWYRAWSELESRLPPRHASGEEVVAKVPPSEMQHLLMHKVDPIYPESAKQIRAQGMVVLDAVIGADGTVRDLRPVSGPDVLEPAALDAVRWWKFEPYRINGRPVEVETTVAVEFEPQ